MRKKIGSCFKEGKKIKPEILCVFDTCKDANDFLGDLAHDLNEMGVPIFDCCRQRLVLETEEYILWCIHMNSHNSFAKIFSNVKYLVNCSMIYKSKKVFQENVAFRLKPDVKEIKNRRELIKLLAGIKFENVGNRMIKIKKNPNGDTRTAPKNVSFEQFQEANDMHIEDVKSVMRELSKMIDVLEMISDCVCAGMARSGEIRDLEIDSDILNRAVKNTAELIKNMIEVKE